MKKLLFISVLNLISIVISAQVSGTVFRDFNSNGTKDNTSTFNEIGLAGVTVTAYDASGASVGTTTSAADGSYTIAGVSGAVRVEFTGLQTGDYSSKSGGTSVQFVTAPITGVDFAVNNFLDYSSPNPTLAEPVLSFGHYSTNANPAIVNYEYSAGAVAVTANTRPPNYNLPAYEVIAAANQVGAVWGLAYNSSTKDLFCSAFQKRHAGFGPGGPGAIYKIDSTGNVTLLTSLPAGTDPHPSTTTFSDWFHDVNSFDPVGKIGLGDIELSKDGNSLFVVNLFNRKLYEISTTSGAIISSFSIPTSNLPLSAPSSRTVCNSSDARPFGLGQKDNKLYVGLVCSAESTQDSLDLWAYVYEFDRNTNTFGTLPVADYSLALMVYNTYNHNWHPWLNSSLPIINTDAIFSPGGYTTYSQPMLTDIIFDQQDMIIGIRDRFGDQLGEGAGSLDTNDPDTYAAFAYGHNIRICYDATLGYQVERNGMCGGVDGTASTGGIGGSSGSGSGAFYFFTQTGQNLSGTGGLAQIVGYKDFASSVSDPFSSSSAGAAWWDHSGGRYTKAYEIYGLPNFSGNLGKTNGVGDIELLSAPAPLEIGNRVWLDTDKDGIQDADERGIDGVVVELLLNGNVVQTQTTASGGQYYFSNVLSDTNYVIRITNASGSTPQDSLLNLSLTNYDQGFNDAIDSDAKLVGTNAEITLRTGSAGENNHTYDFGFYAAQPVIEITKTVNTQYAAVGDDVTFTITVKNSGSAAATGIQVLDTLSSNLSFVSYAAVRPTSATYDNSTGIWNIGDILPGDSAVLTITATIIGEGVIYNIASYNNQSFGGTCVTAPVDFCSDSYTWTLPGALADYNNIQWFKNGVPLTAFDGQLSLTILPADVTDIDTFTVTMTGPAPNNCPLSPCCPLILQKVCPVFDLALKKVVTASGPFAIGADVTFAITVYNQGNVPAYNVEITDYIPTGMSLNDAAWTASGANATYALAGPIAAGDSTTVNITLTVDSAPTAGSSYINWAEISAADDDTDSTNTPPTDVDSTPDGTNFNQSGETNDLLDDNIVDQNGLTGGDEDDHDPAEIIITIPCPNPPCTPLVITKRN
ncbi:MAG: DUF11 domain-containing protein [Saprospiraceae bacterium]|nr:DUF11 domain-containing protein [Saprospiraceae bacterium]